jgi:pantoate--beta-alanine ligase
VTVVSHPFELPAASGIRVLVPTMGALHAGHAELIRQAGQHGDQVVVSIFVNPTQFGPNEDFARYPRDLERDVETVREAGGHVVYAPSVETMYPRERMTKVIVPEVTELYEGAHRPGHFEGVATIVLKLINQVRPVVAVFARKDLQQCAVVRRMVADLDHPVQIEIVETVRESDGLAMSSRNVYLSAEERLIAPGLYTALTAARDAMRNGIEPDSARDEGRVNLEKIGFVVDYFDLVDADRLVPVSKVESGMAIVAAARLGRTRLIDNIVL